MAIIQISKFDIFKCISISNENAFRLLKLNKSEDWRLDIKTLPKSDSEISWGDYNTEDTDTVKSKDSPDNNDIMAIDESEKSKFLHRFSFFKSSYVKYFLMEMNYIAKEEFNLVWTFFDSPHGLSNRFNTSSAADIGKISSIALSNPVFAKIVKTKRYKCYTHKPSNYDEEKTLTEFKPRLYSWENTNKLLWKNGYTGLKTGITQTAGPCLAASFRCEITQEFYVSYHLAPEPTNLLYRLSWF